MRLNFHLPAQPFHLLVQAFDLVQKIQHAAVSEQPFQPSEPGLNTRWIVFDDGSFVLRHDAKRRTGR